jgi:hypothetical protein
MSFLQCRVLVISVVFTLARAVEAESPPTRDHSGLVTRLGQS